MKHTMDSVKIAKRFACVNELHKGHNYFLGNLGKGMHLAWCTMTPPPPTFQNAPPASDRTVHIYFGTFTKSLGVYSDQNLSCTVYDEYHHLIFLSFR